MDIEYLLALQDLRLSLGPVPEAIMAGVSYVGDGPALVALALIVHWCVNKRAGMLAIASLGIGNFACQLAKNIACVYRPWVRDPRILPAEAAIEGAGGYSFPSGHTSGTGTTFGSFAWSLRRKHKFAAFLCVLFVLVVAFSRNFLGVHTPQDVLVGLVVAIASIAVMNAVLNWIERSDAMVPGHRRDIALMVVALVLCAISVAIVDLKPYPMEYVDGTLLVDPESMKKGSFEAAGLLGGLAVGWVLERRIVGFDTSAEVGLGERVVRGIVGVGIVGVVYVATDVAFKAVLPYLWAKLCAYFVLVVFALFVAPLAFKLVQKVFRPVKQEPRGKHAA